MQVITLTTDFGTVDPYVGVMKGVILGIYPYAKILDISHNISPQNIWQANWTLEASHSYFPKRSIHLCVVDPGVGSKRKAIIIETKDFIFVGPNNGVFTWLKNSNQIKQIIEIKEKKYWLDEVSQTFHGRDIFAPVAAHIAKGVDIKNMGPELRIENLVTSEEGLISKKGNKIFGMVEHIDRFGNIITNIPDQDLPKKFVGKINNKKFNGFYKSYTDGKKNEVFGIRGSHGYLEISVNHGNAKKRTGTAIGDDVEITLD